ncbi:hypothetical protein Tco_1149784 [Tanacetum coccineum]
MASMPSANPMLVDLNEMENVFKKLFEFLEKNFKRASIFYTSPDELRLIDVCVEAKLILREWHLNKDLHVETERISKESKDVSNKSKTADTVSNDAFEVTQELLNWKKISQNLRQRTYKDLFDSIQRSRVETNKCDEVKVKVDFDEIETKNIELEYRVASLIKENEHLKLTYQRKRATLGKLNAFDNESCDFESKVIHLEKIIAQKSKDFDDVNLELSNRTAKFEAYFEKLEKTKVVLERQLARKVDDSKAEKD